MPFGRGGATWRGRVTARQRARAALNRPRLHLADEPEPEPPAPVDAARADWPAIVGVQPTWYRVFRLVGNGDAVGQVLVAERRTLEGARAVARLQRSPTVIARGDHSNEIE